MQEKKKAYKCYVCDEEVSILYNFTSINENNNNYTLSKNKENSIICHRICAKCLVRHIFLNEIKVFEKDSMNNSFTCPCTKGKINLDYERLMDVFQNAIFQNLLKKKKKKCEIHAKEFTNYCKNCNVEICEECSNSLYGEHFQHNIITKTEYINKLKIFLSLAPVKYKNFGEFMEKLRIISEKFKELLEKNFNENLKLIDKMINNLIDFRTKYTLFYKKKVINGVRNLKIIKLFYSNYFFDKSRSEKSEDINLHKYLNMINYELDDIKLIKNEECNQKLNEIMNNITYLNSKTENLLEINYQFYEVPKNFKIFQQISKCDSQKITSMIRLNDSTILTGGEGCSLNYWEEKNNKFIKTASFPTDKISCILLLKNENILTSYGKNTHYTIQLWKPNQNYSFDDFLIITNINQEMPEKLSLKNINKVSNINNKNTRETIAVTSKENNLSLKNLQNNFPYEKTISFLSNHTDDITSMIEINSEMFATSALDNKIFIWKEDEHGKYKIFQEINGINDSVNCMFLLYDNRLISGTSDTIYIYHNIEDNITNPNGKFLLQQKLNLPDEKILCLFQIKEGLLISGSNKSILTFWDEIKDVYKPIQKMDLKISNIIAINQLSDKRVIVGSILGKIKILKKEGEKFVENECILRIQNFEIKCIECFESGGFVSAQNNSMIIWKNRENF